MDYNGLEQSFYFAPDCERVLHHNGTTNGLCAEYDMATIENNSIIKVIFEDKEVISSFEVDAQKVDPQSATGIEIFAYCSYMDCISQVKFASQSYQILVNFIRHISDIAMDDIDMVNTKINWKQIIASNMGLFYENGNLNLYRDGMNIMELFKD